MVGVAGIVAASVMTGSSAQAASGGGCYSYTEGSTNRGTYVDIKTCISAPSRGVGRPDAYITLRSGHPACKIAIRVARSGDSRLMSQKTHRCPSGGIRAKRFTAPDFRASSRAYTTFTQIVWTSAGEATLPYRSPWLKLP
ncbi:hypothetical protein J7I98_10565 [Streptomyces sp. ISL-98]|uniref:hypothetical protein n=1 Tax=Streptomyces sp. ISL-98 TaxID=2819192 RepID=UPI001BE9CF5E|nr:hypothetical protein [Streptomyces sp. ISL-98]MBT2506333.1 hypothetical protein [Streptomyces sp. ISL-98]